MPYYTCISGMSKVVVDFKLLIKNILIKSGQSNIILGSKVITDK